MKKILNKDLLNYYFDKFEMEYLFDEEIRKDMQLLFFEKEEFILEAETELEYYYLLVKGKIKVSYLFENGKSMLLKFYEEFITIGDMELLKNIPVRCNVEAIEDSYLIGISSTLLREKHGGNIKFLHHLINSLSEKLEATINNSSYNYVYPLINRLSSYFVGHIIDKNYIDLKSTFQEIAEFLGTTYRHLSRTLNELETKGIIRCDKKRIYILDEKKLRELSKNIYIKALL